MQPPSTADQVSAGLSSRTRERRKNVRFDMHVRVFLRAFGDPWTCSETADLSATGLFVITERPFLLNTPIEYVLTFPTELTKAPQQLRVRFYASVIRCEHIPGANGSYGVAVRNSAHRYLTSAEAVAFDVLDRKQDATINQVAPAPERKPLS